MSLSETVDLVESISLAVSAERRVRLKMQLGAEAGEAEWRRLENLIRQGTPRPVGLVAVVDVAGSGLQAVPAAEQGKPSKVKKKRVRKPQAPVGTLHPRGTRTFTTRQLADAWNVSLHVVREKFLEEEEGVINLGKPEKMHQVHRNHRRYEESTAYRVCQRLKHGGG